MRNLFRKILLFVNLALVVLLLLSYMAVYVSPATVWIIAFIGLAYPYILIVNLFFVILWILLRKWYFLISLLMILAGWNALKKSVQVKLKKESVETGGDSFRLLSYNVRLFNYYLWEKDTAVKQKIMEYIYDEAPSVVCFQEFLTLSGGGITLAQIKSELKEWPYSHVYYMDRIQGKTNFGLATFSKFPIIHKGFIEYSNSLNGVIYSDVIMLHDTIRIYNCHLQSVRLKQDYNKVLDSLIFNYDQRYLSEVKSISVKLRDAYIRRASQADQLARHIKASPHPVIVCGDFNDTPHSYCYHKLSRNLKDAFVTSGSGTGSTYRPDFAPIRIDFILYSPILHSSNYTSTKTGWSDHYPVQCDFKYIQKADSAGLHSRR
ncbi:MAG: endonuclease/exonuclease/phosphatase family protein [Bacteroidales bacterium]|nr:endonuclease/exonuclease/phosphatase family protein [Bacteroidales bacterium]